MKGIRVEIQTEDRLVAINSLASAIDKLASALCISPKVEIIGCKVNNAGIHVNTTEKVTETLIEKEE